MRDDIIIISLTLLASFPGRAGEGKNGLVSIVCACAGISVYYSGYYAVKLAKQFTAAYAVKISRARNNRVHEYSSSCRFCLKNVASNHSVGLFTIQAIGQDLSGRLSKLLLVPVTQSDGLSQSICRTWRIADICSSLSVKRPSPTLCSASVSPWSKLETHSAILIVRATLYILCGSVHVM